MIAAAGLGAVVAGASWTLVQDKFSQTKDSDAELRLQIRDIRAELLQRRHEFVTTEIHDEFKARMIDRLRALEERTGRTGERLRVLERERKGN
jgi:hypothetical protein